nr:reverse transcriptase domain-containing protein [Tanacetum cinerariifolium]
MLVLRLLMIVQLEGRMLELRLGLRPRRMPSLEDYPDRVTADESLELIPNRVAKALEGYDTARNPRTETKIDNDQQDDNIEANGNNGNGNGNWNKNHNVNNGVGVDAAYAMMWKALMKLMTEVYCPKNEIQKMENKLWNLIVKGNDLTAYDQRFEELTLLCTKMVLKEEDQVERYIRGLLDNIQGRTSDRTS